MNQRIIHIVYGKCSDDRLHLVSSFLSTLIVAAAASLVTCHPTHIQSRLKSAVVTATATTVHPYSHCISPLIPFANLAHRPKSSYANMHFSAPEKATRIMLARRPSREAALQMQSPRHRHLRRANQHLLIESLHARVQDDDRAVGGGLPRMSSINCGKECSISISISIQCK